MCVCVVWGNCIDYSVPVCTIKCSTRSTSQEEGHILAHSLKGNSIIGGGGGDHRGIAVLVAVCYSGSRMRLLAHILVDQEAARSRLRIW